MLESILNQSYKDIELIVVDDGSVDSTYQILEAYAAKDNRLKIFSPGKLGKNGAYNYAAQQVHGEWYMVFGADDIMEPGILEKWVEKAKKYNPMDAEVVIASRLRMFTNDIKFKRYQGLEVPKDKMQVCVSGTAYLASHKVWENTYPVPSGFPNEDTWIALYFEYIVKKENYIAVPEICTNYRIHANNSLNKEAKYDEFNEKYHQRLLILSEFQKRYNDRLTKEQHCNLSAKIRLEELRYAHKPLQIIFLKDFGFVERMRNILLSKHILYLVKLRLNRILLGHS